jgi:hypothetical protein
VATGGGAPGGKVAPVLHRICCAVRMRGAERVRSICIAMLVQPREGRWRAESMILLV